jgi:hypothetical protein
MNMQLLFLLVLTTWYTSKLYYTRDPYINFPELDDHGLMTAKCSHCSQYLVINQEQMRNPFYCNLCK